MIGVIVKDNLVENLITLNESQIDELSQALNCEIIAARPYDLTIGNL